MTKGKLIFIILVIISILNYIFYYNLYGHSPFYFHPFESMYTLITGISIALSVIALFVILIIYMFDNWNKKI